MISPKAIESWKAAVSHLRGKGLEPVLPAEVAELLARPVRRVA